MTKIDGQGRTLMLGLIDTHQHLMLGGPHAMQTARDHYDLAVVGAIGARAMKEFRLLKGVTSIRDIGGNSLGLAKAVKNSVLVGPRIYAAGPSLSQTGGHSDFGYWSDAPGEKDKLEVLQQTYGVDGVAEVLRAVRSNFRRGAAFIKIMAGGVSLVNLPRSKQPNLASPKCKPFRVWRMIMGATSVSTPTMTGR